MVLSPSYRFCWTWAGVIFQEQSTLDLMIHRILTHMMCLIQVTAGRTVVRGATVVTIVTVVMVMKMMVVTMGILVTETIVIMILNIAVRESHGAVSS